MLCLADEPTLKYFYFTLTAVNNTITVCQFPALQASFFFSFQFSVPLTRQGHVKKNNKKKDITSFSKLFIPQQLHEPYLQMYVDCRRSSTVCA